MNLPERLPPGWERWNTAGGGRLVLAFRPDVFDAETFDPACLPTITVAPGRSPDRPPTAKTGRDGWHVVLHLEPDVRVSSATTSDREAAVDRAVEIAEQFSAGEIDFRNPYQRPREAYLDELAALTEGA